MQNLMKEMKVRNKFQEIKNIDLIWILKMNLWIKVDQLI